MFFVVSFFVCLFLGNTAQSTQVFRYSMYDDNDLKKDLSKKLLAPNTMNYKIDLDDDEYDNSILASDYAEEAKNFFKKGNIIKATDSYIKAAWSGDEESINFMESLLNDRKISDIYNLKNKQRLNSYFEPLYKKLNELKK